MKKLVIGIIFFLIMILTCSFSYKAGLNNVEIKTLYEDNHKYVVATIYNKATGNCCGISIVHSEACSCHKK